VKAVRIPVATDSPIEVVDAGGGRWEQLARMIGDPCSYIEIVNCVLTPEFSLVMVVDEEGLLNGQPPNRRAQYLYPFSPITGTVLVMCEGWVNDGMDLVDLPDPEQALALVKGVTQ
jgi:hypothetical protein